MTTEQIKNISLVGETVLVERKMIPKHKTILMPDGTNSPEMYDLEDRVLKFSIASQKAFNEEGLEFSPTILPLFASHMQPVAVLDTIKKEDGTAVAVMVINYRHIVGYDYSSK
jgi:hypothetical protein